MAVSIAELDATVRAFYEGRGEQVGLLLLPFFCFPGRRLMVAPDSKKLRRQL